MSSTVKEPYLVVYATTILLIINNLTLPVFCGGKLYTIDKRGNFYSIDVNTKNKTLINENTPDYTHELEYDCINRIMYANRGEGIYEAYQIDIQTGNDSNVIGIDIDYSANEFVGSSLYTWRKGDDNSKGGSFRIINPVDFSTIANVSDGNVPMLQVGGLAYDIYTNTMYGITSQGVDSWLFVLDLDTGVPSFIGNTHIESISALTFDDNGVLYGSTSGSAGYEGAIYTIDTETAEAEFFVQVSVWNIGGLEFVSNSGECVTKTPTASPSQAPTQTTNNPSTQTNNPTQNPTTDDSSESSDDYANGLLAANEENKNSDQFENQESIQYVVNIDGTMLFYIFIIIIIFFGVIMGGYWCLQKKQRNVITFM